MYWNSKQSSVSGNEKADECSRKGSEKEVGEQNMELTATCNHEYRTAYETTNSTLDYWLYGQPHNFCGCSIIEEEPVFTQHFLCKCPPLRRMHFT